MASSFFQADAATNRHDASLARVFSLVDRQLAPLGLKAIDALNPRAGEAILDVGCGAGQTLIQIAERVGANGRVIGVDISKLLLSIAHKRSANHPKITLIEADAQTLELPNVSLDGVFSRFGVMGFTNPPVAFENFNRLLKPGRRLVFCCWRTLEENELDHFPITAAQQKVDVRATPFSFADPSYVHQLLEQAGFENVTIEAYDQRVSCGSVDETMDVLLSVGALGQAVREKPSLRAEVELPLREALMARADVTRVELTAAVWIVSGTARK